MKKTKLDKPLLIVMLVLMIFGLIMVLSASSMASYMRYHKDIYDYFTKMNLEVIVYNIRNNISLKNKELFDNIKYII